MMLLQTCLLFLSYIGQQRRPKQAGRLYYKYYIEMLLIFRE